MKWILISVFVFVNIFAQGQSNSRFYFTDTVQISGVLIYDTKKGNNYVHVCQECDAISTCFAIKLAIKKNSYRLLEPNDIIALYRRINYQKLSFCKNENKEEYIMTNNKMLNERYYIIPFKDEYFIKVFYDGKEYITFKCW